MDPHIPEDILRDVISRSTGNTIHNDGIGRTGAIILGIIAGIALGMSILTLVMYSQSYKELERENRLLQLKVDDMRVALNSQGISTNKHAASDSP